MEIQSAVRKILAYPKETGAIITHYGKEVRYTDDSYVHTEGRRLRQGSIPITIEEAAILILRFGLLFIGDEGVNSEYGVKNPHGIEDAKALVLQSPAVVEEFLPQATVIQLTG